MTALNFDKLAEGESTFGLDISSTRIKAMWIEKAGPESMKLRGFGEEAIPASAVVGGIIRRPEVVAEAIKKILKEAYPRPIREKYVVCSVPQEKVYLKIEDFPNLEKEKLRKAVIWKAKDILAMPLDKIYWDWHRLSVSEDSNMVSIQFAAVEKEVIDSYVNAINLAGLIPLTFEMEACASARVVFSYYEKMKDLPVLFVDIGNSNSNLAIYHNGGFRFNSSVKIGGNQILKIVSTEKNFTPAEAEEYIRTTGLTTKTESLKTAMTASLEALISEINSAIRFYDKTPDKKDDIVDVLIYGDGSGLKGLDKYLSEKLSNLRVRYADPRVRMIPIPQIISHQKIYPHLAVVGLALSKLEKYAEFKDVNFLPPNVQADYVNDQLKKRLGTILKVFAINAIALSGFMLGGWFLLDQNSAQLDASINAKKSVLQSAKIQGFVNEIESFNDSLKSVSSIIKSEFNWLKIFDKIIASVPSNVTLTSLDIYLDESIAASKEPSWTINIYGKTDNRQTVVDFSNVLANTDLFTNVQVPVSAFSTSNEVEFRINMSLTFTKILNDPDNFVKGGSSTKNELILNPIK